MIAARDVLALHEVHRDELAVDAGTDRHRRPWSDRADAVEVHGDVAGPRRLHGDRHGPDGRRCIRRRTPRQAAEQDAEEGQSHDAPDGEPAMRVGPATNSVEAHEWESLRRPRRLARPAIENRVT